MKISIRQNKELIQVLCMEINSMSVDIKAALKKIAESRHFYSQKAAKLYEVEFNLFNFLDSEKAINDLYNIDRLLNSYMQNGDNWLISAALIEEEAAYAAPIQQPPLMLGLAGNCAQTWRGSKQQIPNYPVGYTRPWRSLSGHNQNVLLKDEYVTSFRCANELGVVIGREAHKVAASEAMDYVFGYTIVNDMISNYWKDFAVDENPEKNPSFEELLTTSYYGRGTDGFAPVGPFIVSKEEVGDPYNLQMITRFNSVQRDRAYSNAMIIGIEETIEYFSKIMPLQPGSIIHMGTMGVDGVTLFEDQFLNDTDIVEMEIERIGVLKTRFNDQRKKALK